MGEDQGWVVLCEEVSAGCSPCLYTKGPLRSPLPHFSESALRVKPPFWLQARAANKPVLDGAASGVTPRYEQAKIRVWMTQLHPEEPKAQA